VKLLYDKSIITSEKILLNAFYFVVIWRKYNKK